MSNLDNFFTWETLLTYGGCIAGTVLVTEWLKRVFAKVPTQIVSFIVAVLILFVGHLATGTMVWADAPLYLVNSIAVSLAANGGFDALKRTFIKKGNVDELVIDNDKNNGGVYLNLSKDPEAFEDGEVVSFKVKKVDVGSQE